MLTPEEQLKYQLIHLGHLKSTVEREIAGMPSVENLTGYPLVENQKKMKFLQLKLDSVNQQIAALSQNG
jgi:uncharacterized protein YwqG